MREAHKSVNLISSSILSGLGDQYYIETEKHPGLGTRDQNFWVSEFFDN